MTAAPGGPADRRTVDRLDILGALHGEIMVFQPMNVREISARGLLVETSTALHVNSLHELRLTLGPHSLIVRGRVVHSSISDIGQEQVVYRSGLEFIEPTAHVEGVIAGFLAAVQEERRQP